MRRVAVAALSVSTLVVAVLAAPTVAAAAPAAVPTAPYTALGIQASPGAHVGGADDTGGAVEVTGAAVTVERLTASKASFTSSGGRLVLDMTAPTGTSWQTGQVLPVSVFGGSQNAFVRVGYLPNRDCTISGTDSGSVSVVEAAYDGDTLTAFGADLDLGCGSARYSAYVRWHSSVGYAGLTLTEVVGFAGVDLGGFVDRTVTLTATGTDPLPVVESTAIGGVDPEAFSVVGDDCKQQALAAGTSCTVVVRARPLVAGSVAGTLVLVHDTASPWVVPLTASADDVVDGTYQAKAPQRILDTRNGVGVGGRKGPVGPNGVIHLDVGSYLNRPASAVVLNLTVDRPTASGYLSTYPTGGTRPVVSSINFPAGWQGANLVTIPIGAGGRVDIFNLNGQTSVIADLVGFYGKGDQYRGTGGGYHPKSVERLLDTRTWGHGKLPAGAAVILGLSYPNDGGDIAAMSTTITAVRPTKAGYLTAWSGDGGPPVASTLNFSATSGVISNAAVVPVAYSEPDCPECAIFKVINKSPAPIDLIVDINGFFDRGDLTANVRYFPLAAPTRIVDTRLGQGATTLGQGVTRTVTAPTSVAGYDTIALDSNITAVSPTAGTYITVWPTFDDYPRPLASVLNPNAKQTIANHAIAEVGYGNRFNLFNAVGTTNLVVDLSGTFEFFPRTPADQIPHQGGDPGSARLGVAAGGAAAGVATTGTASRTFARPAVVR